MAKDKQPRVIVAHEDGRTYSVTEAKFEKLYKDQGFKITGEETPSAFVPVGVPRQPRSRTKPRAKGARVAKPATPARPPKPVLATPDVPADVPVIPEPATEP